MRVITSFDEDPFAGIEVRSSQGVVKDYFHTTDNVQQPERNNNIWLDMYENDAVLTTAVDTTVDVATRNGIYFEGSDRRIKELTNLFENEIDFDQLLPNLISSLLIYGDAFLEVRRLDGVIKELHILESTEMFIQYDEHGRVLGYVQRPNVATQVTSARINTDSNQVQIQFSKDDVIHIPLKQIGSGVYSRQPFRSIMREFATKKRGVAWISGIFTNFAPRLMYILKNSSVKQTKQFIDNLKIAKNQAHKDLVALGDTEVKETGLFKFDTGLVDLLNYLRQEILMITKVPPIWVGIPDNSNRSNSEAQIRSFETRVKSIQSKIESVLNKTLLPALGFKNEKFRFKPFSLLEEKQIILNALDMVKLGTERESIQNYLKAKGLDIELKEPDILNITTPNNLDASSDNPGNPGEPGEEDLDKRNTGEDAQARGKDRDRKQAEQQIRSQYEKYPYVFEVTEQNG